MVDISSASKSLQNTLDVLQDVIANQIQVQSVSNNGKLPTPTPTEHFALILSILSAPSASTSLSSLSTIFLPELLKILVAVLPKTSVSVAVQHIKLANKVFIGLLHSHSFTSKQTLNISEEKSDAIVFSSLSALAALMNLVASKINEKDTSATEWLKAINCFLSFIDDPRAKIRKFSHQHIISLVTSTKGIGAASRSYIGDFCVEVLKGCTRSSYNRSMSVIVLFDSGCLARVPPAQMAAAVEASLQLQKCGVNRLTAAVYRMMDSFFQLLVQQQPTLTSGERDGRVEAVNRSVQLLLRHPPDTADM